LLLAYAGCSEPADEERAAGQHNGFLILGTRLKLSLPSERNNYMSYLKNSKSADLNGIFLSLEKEVKRAVNREG